MTYEVALSALSDPTRRQLFEALSKRPGAVSALAKNLPISRPAVSQHLKILSDAGLVTCEKQGTRRIYRADPKGLAEVRRYLDQLWGDALENFAAYLEKEKL